jgi:hypothetical protein
MARGPEERARVCAGFVELLARLRAAEPPAMAEAERDRRLALAGTANGRAAARHGRPLMDWYLRWERERESREEALGQMKGD